MVKRLGRVALAGCLACLAGLPSPLSPAAAQAQETPVDGIDVSRFQGRIEWSRVARTDVEFAFVQASRGSGADCLVAPNRCGLDEYYHRNYARAVATGIRVGAYHRAFTGGDGPRGVRVDARREAKLFLFQVQVLRDGDLLPALDVETPFGGLNRRELRVWIRTWLKKVGAELGVMPIIYTNRSSWLATGDTTSFALRGYPLWVANFDVEAPAVPAANWAGRGWSIWQHTSSGRVNGIDGNVDRDVLAVPLEEISVPPGGAG